MRINVNPNARPTQMEHHLMQTARELLKKGTWIMGVLEALNKEVTEWKQTRAKYRHARTSVVYWRGKGMIEVLGHEGKVVFTID